MQHPEDELVQTQLRTEQGEGRDADVEQAPAERQPPAEQAADQGERGDRREAQPDGRTGRATSRPGRDRRPGRDIRRRPAAGAASRPPPTQAQSRGHAVHVRPFDHHHRRAGRDEQRERPAAERDGDAGHGDHHHAGGEAGGRSDWDVAGVAHRPPNRRSRRGIFGERGAQRVAVEIGPQRVDEQQLGIGRLPQQEVGQPHLARGADQQVERRQVARCRARRRSPPRRSSSASISPRDRLPARSRAAAAISARDAVIERDHQGQPVVAGGALDGALDQRCDDPARRRCDRRSCCSRTPSCASVVQLALEIEAQQAHEVGDLVLRPPPVLRRKG